MPIPHALVLRAPGTNCDNEVQAAFEMVGGLATRLHINALRDNPRLLRDYQILVLPGGFSYGDDIAAGKVQAIAMQHFLSDAMRQFRDDEKLILGICNGFQALLKAGILIPPDEDGPLATLASQTPLHRHGWDFFYGTGAGSAATTAGKTRKPCEERRTVPDPSGPDIPGARLQSPQADF